MSELKICVVTGSRADYGLLYCLMRLVQQDPSCRLQVAVTGMHLSPEFGLTYRSIESDGFSIDASVETILSSGSPQAIAKSIGLGVIGFADAFFALQPDIVVVLGDRYEILAAVQSALVAAIPVAHVSGGDVTEGSIDESFRHCITKMSHLHFVTNQESRDRVARMGEDPSSIYVVGSPGIDYIKHIKLMSRPELETSLGFQLRQRNLLITFHPVTSEPGQSALQFQQLLLALHDLPVSTGLIFTQTNADMEGRELMRLTEDFVANHENAVLHVSLGQLRYLSAIQMVDAVVGNSSSGLYEVPSFKKPTVNIGNRQKGRLQASSVLNAEPTSSNILAAIQKAFTVDCSQTTNPYGDGTASLQILKAIRQQSNLKKLVRKSFFEPAHQPI